MTVWPGWWLGPLNPIEALRYEWGGPDACRLLAHIWHSWVLVRREKGTDSLMIDRMNLECSVCRQHGRCPVPAGFKEAPARPEDRGAPVVAAAVIVFLLPLATAIAAAFLGGRFAAPRPDSVALWQGGGAGAGLLVGVIVARVLVARGRPGGEPE